MNTGPVSAIARGPPPVVVLEGLAKNSSSSCDDGFAVRMQSARAKEAIEARTATELKMFEQMEDYLQKRSKLDQEYATALTKLNKAVAVQKLDDLPEHGCVVKAWNTFLAEGEVFATLVQQRAQGLTEEMHTHVQPLFKDKKRARSKYLNDRTKIDTDMQRLMDDTAGALQSAQKYAREMDSAREKYEEHALLAARNEKLAKQADKSKLKYSLAVAKFQNHHNHTVLSIEECNRHRERHYATILPTLLSSLQESQEYHVSAWVDTLNALCNVMDCTSDDYANSFANIRSAINGISKEAEFMPFQEEFGADPYKPAPVTFVKAPQHSCPEESVVTGDLLITKFTQGKLSEKKRDTELQHQAIDRQLEERKEELAENHAEVQDLPSDNTPDSRRVRVQHMILEHGLALDVVCLEANQSKCESREAMLEECFSTHMPDIEAGSLGTGAEGDLTEDCVRAALAREGEDPESRAQVLAKQTAQRAKQAKEQGRKLLSAVGRQFKRKSRFVDAGDESPGTSPVSSPKPNKRVLVFPTLSGRSSTPSVELSQADDTPSAATGEEDDDDDQGTYSQPATSTSDSTPPAPLPRPRSKSDVTRGSEPHDTPARKARSPQPQKRAPKRGSANSKSSIPSIPLRGSSATHSLSSRRDTASSAVSSGTLLSLDIQQDEAEGDEAAATYSTPSTVDTLSVVISDSTAYAVPPPPPPKPGKGDKVKDAPAPAPRPRSPSPQPKPRARVSESAPAQSEAAPPPQRSSSSEPPPASPGVLDDFELPLDRQPWYHGKLARKAANALLQTAGDFLVRESTTKPGQYVLTAWGPKDATPRQFIIQTDVPGHFRFENEPFPTIVQLLQHYCDNQLIVSKQSGVILSNPVISSDRQWHYAPECVALGDKLGEGNFGDVCRAMLTCGASQREVAVKTCKAEMYDPELFMQEAEITKRYQHPNLVNILGVTTAHPYYIIMELCHEGQLLTYLRGTKASLVEKMRFATEAASGMVYIASRNAIHRDVAARNCLLTEDLSLKISDFGMMRQAEEGLYEISAGRKQIPVKWTAPEALRFGTYSTQSDVWSFGILLWEIFANGKSPYRGKSNPETQMQVEEGYRLPAPKETPKIAYELMKKCWQEQPGDRPSFVYIHERLQASYDAFCRLAAGEASG